MAVKRLILKWQESFCADNLEGEKNKKTKNKKMIAIIRVTILDLKDSKWFKNLSVKDLKSHSLKKMPGSKII